MHARRVAILLSAGAIAAAAWWTTRDHDTGRVAAFRNAGPLPRVSSAPVGRSFAEEWQELLEAIRSGKPAFSVRERIESLRRRWLNHDDSASVAAAIGSILRSGDDAVTGLAFQVGPGSSLQGWPTLRVFLLDLLQTLDPELAVAIGREILARPRSAEEFAVALRPLARRGPWRASDAELETHLATLLGQQQWQAEGSPGFAEALDLARATATPGVTRLLSRWLDSRPPLAKAGVMALHETAAECPAAVTTVLATDFSLLENSAHLRAQLMARASASDASQQSALDSYLAHPGVSVNEKRSFLALYPLRSTTTGHRLYGDAPSPYRRDAVVADDQAALAQVERWIANPALAPLQEDLEPLRDRLLRWTAQATP